MNSIEIVDHCFGSDVVIDGISIDIDPENNNNIEEILKLRKELFNELFEISDKISNYDLKYIAEVVARYSDKFEYSEEESDNRSPCDQCGNWNYSEKYIKKDNE
jgi:hypothetical protein